MSPAAKKALAKTGAGLFWILLWALLAHLVGQAMLLPSPLLVVKTLLSLASGADFWLTLLNSLARILSGMLAGTLLGVLLAVLTHGSAVCRAIIAPFMSLVKSTPVASFIILALIWLGRGVVPLFITALMVMPVVWANVSEGLRAQDEKLLEVARVFRLPRHRVFFSLTLPTVLPYFRSALCSALGLGWKAGVAAEVLTVPQRSVGRMIYESKLYLETPELFAWTVTVIAVSFLIERLLLRLVSGLWRKGDDEHA